MHGDAQEGCVWIIHSLLFIPDWETYYIFWFFTWLSTFNKFNARLGNSAATFIVNPLCPPAKCFCTIIVINTQYCYTSYNQLVRNKIITIYILNQLVLHFPPVFLASSSLQCLCVCFPGTVPVRTTVNLLRATSHELHLLLLCFFLNFTNQAPEETI